MKEYYYDKLLNIQTRGDQEGFNNSYHYYRYESTPYHGLETLCHQVVITRDDRIVDFGCGKGRVSFFLHYFYQATVVGIEMNDIYYQEAIKNRYRYLEKHPQLASNIYFYNCLAETYSIDPYDNKFYFFNPFSIQIFMKIINKILRSVEEVKRTVELIIYYGSEDYIDFLEYQTIFELKEEIIIPGMYEKNTYERFLIYQLSY